MKRYLRARSPPLPLLFDRIEGSDVYELETVDHGEFVGVDGDRPVETAMSGRIRVRTTRST